MFQERIREEAKSICQRHAVVGGAGPNDMKMAFLVKVQSCVSPCLLFNKSTINELVKDLDMGSDEFIYVLDIYSELSSLIFPNETDFKALVEEYVFSFGKAGEMASKLPPSLNSLGKSLPTFEDVREAIETFPFLIAVHAMTTWLLPMTPEKKKGAAR